MSAPCRVMNRLGLFRKVKRGWRMICYSWRLDGLPSHGHASCGSVMQRLVMQECVHGMASSAFTWSRFCIPSSSSLSVCLRVCPSLSFPLSFYVCVFIYSFLLSIFLPLLFGNHSHEMIHLSQTIHAIKYDNNNNGNIMMKMIIKIIISITIIMILITMTR